MSKKYFGYLNEIDYKGRNFTFEEAKRILLTERYFAFGEDNHSSSVIACKCKDFYLYDLNTKEFLIPVRFDHWKNYNKWKILPMPKNKFNNKFVGSDFDTFAEENNIRLKRDINWALDMLKHGKIVTREGNPKIYLFPPDNYDNSNVKITAEDLFAEDWEIFHFKTFKDVLDDMYAGKTIRRKSWHPDLGIGMYTNSLMIKYEDLLADDWEVVDVVAEVDKMQDQIMKDRNEY